MITIGSKGETVEVLQRGLASLGFDLGPIDGIFGARTRAAVTAWQSRNKLYPDGVFGVSSCKAWNGLMVQYPISLDTSEDDPPVSDRPLLRRMVLRADPYADGYKVTSLRSDIAERYKGLYAEVHSLGGIITSAGGFRGLKAASGPARSVVSFHYVGRAFDLAVYSGCQDLEKDPYIVVRDGNCTTVWAKSGNAPKVTLEAMRVEQLRVKGERRSLIHVKPWTGQAFNFSEVAARWGFKGINGKTSFWTGGSYAGAEWWHFQNAEGLIPKVTTFGEELLKSYTLDQIKRDFKNWEEARGRKYKIAWF